jgi:hypothetical protein
VIESENAWPVRDIRGRYFVTNVGGTDVIVFDSTGQYITRLGRRGGGPGEFESIVAIDVVNDTVYVFDGRHSRLSLFGPDLRFARSVALDLKPTTRALVLPDGRLIVNASVRTSAAVGQPLHLMEAGKLIRSFGSETGVFRMDVPGLLDRSIVAAGASNVWSAHQRAYLVDLLDVSTGTLLMQFARTASWFPSGERPRIKGGSFVDEPPPPRLASIATDAAGLLWLGFSVADVRWRQAVKETEPGHVAIADPGRYLDAIVEVIDPQSGTLVATERFDNPPGLIIGPGLRARTVLTPDGTPIIKVFRVTLHRTPNTP